MNEGKIKMNTNPERHFEVVKRFLENKNEEAILDCLELLDKKKKSIGVGTNAEVFAIEDEPLLSTLCVKEIAKFPKSKINNIETEFDFQEAVNNLGVKTPRNVMMVRNTETKKEYLIMERIKGYSIGDLTDKHKNCLITDNYNHEKFFEKLQVMVDKMHEKGIYHRDMHSGNVMVDEAGDPVIIDFGTADYGYGQDEEIYKGVGYVLTNEAKGEYTRSDSLPLRDDQRQVQMLKIQMKMFDV